MKFKNKLTDLFTRRDCRRGLIMLACILVSVALGLLSVQLWSRLNLWVLGQGRPSDFGTPLAVMSSLSLVGIATTIYKLFMWLLFNPTVWIIERRRQRRLKEWTVD